ncbi:MAG: PorT family protein [Bacteroidales bacterium]|nr:PorT family protein [Bacteroidales bacterium]
MKKALILLIAMLAGQLAFGQLSLGPKIGYTASSLSTDADDINEDMKSSLHFGAFARLGTKVYFQPEVLWMTKGTEFGFEPNLFQGSAEVTQDVDMKTIDVPLLVGVKLVNLKVTNIRAMAGPVASFVMDKEIEAEDVPASFTIEDKDINDANWGIQIGAGVDVLKFSLDVRYEIGLNDIAEGDDDDFNYGNLKNNAFLVSLGWAIF